jgi:branched-subunit amino acid aminotransferase/4-amino-4-deoxychorismate lyase
MVSISYSADKGWHDARVIPYGPIELDPSAIVLRYAQEIFEVLKAYRWADGSITSFRPQANAARLQNSVRRLAIPELPVEMFIDSLRQLIVVDGSWVPSGGEIRCICGHSLSPPGPGWSLALDAGLSIEQRRIDIHEWQDKTQSGEISEVFACGAAAVITPVSLVKHGDGEFMIADGAPGGVTMALRDTLTGVQRGTFLDTHRWMTRLGRPPSRSSSES